MQAEGSSPAGYPRHVAGTMIMVLQSGSFDGQMFATISERAHWESTWRQLRCPLGTVFYVTERMGLLRYMFSSFEAPIPEWLPHDYRLVAMASYAWHDNKKLIARRLICGPLATRTSSVLQCEICTALGWARVSGWISRIKSCLFGAVILACPCCEEGSAPHSL